MYIFNKDKTYKLNSIVTSKLLKKQQFKKFDMFFVVKSQKKDQVLFFFIILYLMSGNAPKIIDKKMKLKKKFLGFHLSLNFFFLYSFILMYLAILDTINFLKTKSNCEHNLVFKEFPIIYEVDAMCEQFNPVLEYIKSYKFILNLKSTPKSYIWIDSEFLLRLAKLPYIDGLR